MANSVDNRTGFQQYMDRASAEKAIEDVRNSTYSNSPLAKLWGFFTDDAAARQQREVDGRSLATVANHSNYLVDAMAADPKKIAEVEKNPLKFARDYTSLAWMSPVDHSNKVAAADMPPGFGKPHAPPVGSPAGDQKVAAAPTMTAGQQSAQNQVDYITALRSNPAMQGMTFRDLAGYVGLQPATARATGKDVAIGQTLTDIDSQYKAAVAAAQQIAQEDPKKASDILAAATSQRLADHMRLVAPPDPTRELLAAADGT